MDDLISRQAVKDWLLKWEGYIDKDTITRMQYRVIDIRPAEVEPVRHGRWIEHKSKDWSGGGAYICSVCGYGYSWAGFHEANEFTYCPNCGTRMEG